MIREISPILRTPRFMSLPKGTSEQLTKPWIKIFYRYISQLFDMLKLLKRMEKVIKPEDGSNLYI